MIVTVIVPVRNEEYLLPFFLRHYEKFADSIYVYDNGSTDRTIEIADAHPKVCLRHFDTGGQLKETGLLSIKNEKYKGLFGDWFIIVDCDEFLYHSDVRAYLEKCDSEGVTLPKVSGYEMVCNDPPKDDGSTPITEIVKSGFLSYEYSKHVAVHKSVDVRYLPGCHYCKPFGVVKKSNKPDLKLLHYRWLGEVFYRERNRFNLSIMSEENKRNDWGRQFVNPEPNCEWYKKWAPTARDVIT